MWKTFRAHPLLSIREFIFKKNPMNMVNVGSLQPDLIPAYLRESWEHSAGGTALADVSLFLHNREFILEKLLKFEKTYNYNLVLSKSLSQRQCLGT
jgi:hypothetical protein